MLSLQLKYMQRISKLRLQHIVLSKLLQYTGYTSISGEKVKGIGLLKSIQQYFSFPFFYIGFLFADSFSLFSSSFSSSNPSFTPSQNPFERSNHPNRYPIDPNSQTFHENASAKASPTTMPMPPCIKLLIRLPIIFITFSHLLNLFFVVSFNMVEWYCKSKVVNCQLPAGSLYKLYFIHLLCSGLILIITILKVFLSMLVLLLWFCNRKGKPLWEITERSSFFFLALKII